MSIFTGATLDSYHSTGVSLTRTLSTRSTISKPTSAQLWQLFTSNSRSIRSKNITAYCRRQDCRTATTPRAPVAPFQCSKYHRAAFDLCAIAVAPRDFLKMLSRQYSEAVGVIPAPVDVDGAIVSLDTAETCTRVCTLGVTVNNLTLLGTPTFLFVFIYAFLLGRRYRR